MLAGRLSSDRICYRRAKGLAKFVILDEEIANEGTQVGELLFDLLAGGNSCWGGLMRVHIRCPFAGISGS